MNTNFLQTRRGIITVLLITGLILAAFSLITSYTFISIKDSGSGEKAVYLNSDEGELVKQLQLNGTDKTMLVRKGSYKINVVAGDKQTIYERDLKSFSTNTLDIEVKDQKKAAFSGNSDLPCSSVASGVWFYSCNPSTSGLVSRGAASAAGPVSAGLGSDFSQALKPYGNNFIRATVLNDTLEIVQVVNGAASGSPLQIGDFKGAVSDNYFGVSADGKAFTVLDTEKNELLYFKDTSDSSPKRISLANSGAEVKDLETNVITGGKHIFLANYTTELHVEEGESPTNDNQKILVYRTDGGLEEEYALDDSWFVTGISAGAEDKILLFLNENGFDKTYLVDGLRGIKQVTMGLDKPQEACWKDNDSFYVLSDEGRSIHLYSIADRAAFRVYEGLTEDMQIPKLVCSQGRLTFTISSDDDGAITEFRHFALNDEAHTGVRLESLLPLYFGSAANAYRAVPDPAGVRIETVYGPGSKEEAAALLDGRLKQLGAGNTRPNIVYGF